MGAVITPAPWRGFSGPPPVAGFKRRHCHRSVGRCGRRAAPPPPCKPDSEGVRSSRACAQLVEVQRGHCQYRCANTSFVGRWNMKTCVRSKRQPAGCERVCVRARARVLFCSVQCTRSQRVTAGARRCQSLCHHWQCHWQTVPVAVEAHGLPAVPLAVPVAMTHRQWHCGTPRRRRPPTGTRGPSLPMPVTVPHWQ